MGVDVLKVSVKSPNPSYPNYPDEYITISGVLLVPKFLLIPPTVKLVVTPPPIIVNSACPSVLFEDPDKVSADDFGALYNFWVWLFAGAFVATSFVHAMETDPSYDETVDVLVAGGTPADLKYMIDTALHADSLSLPYLYMYVMCGYKANGYDELNLADLKKKKAFHLESLFW